MNHLLNEVFPGVRGLRSVIYEVSASTQTIAVFKWQGRHDPPTDFVRGVGRGDAVFASIETATEELVFVSDTWNIPSKQATYGENYRTFIAAPVRSKEDAYGMITLDSTQPGDLDSRDGDLLETVASVLALFFAEAARGRR